MQILPPSASNMTLFFITSTIPRRLVFSLLLLQLFLMPQKSFSSLAVSTPRLAVAPLTSSFLSTATSMRTSTRRNPPQEECNVIINKRTREAQAKQRQVLVNKRRGFGLDKTARRRRRRQEQQSWSSPQQRPEEGSHATRTTTTRGRPFHATSRSRCCSMAFFFPKAVGQEQSSSSNNNNNDKNPISTPATSTSKTKDHSARPTSKRWSTCLIGSPHLLRSGGAQHRQPTEHDLFATTVLSHPLRL